jgi:hypothetical protein
MDGSQFDNLLRFLTESRRSIVGGALIAAAGWFGGTTVDAKKKKKKPCKKKCKDGCCTKKFGKCIRPAQQSGSQCGTGGEICRSTGCGGGCGAGCDTCCADGDCVDAGQISPEQCGTGGEACFACPVGQACNAPGEGCCALQGAACGGSGVECCSHLFVICGEGNICCVENHGACTQTSDCCDDEDVCDNGFCGRPLDAACVPGDVWCVPQLECNPSTLRCSACPEEQEPCNGVCCDAGESCYGTVCCALNFGCSRPNGGAGSCCQFQYCCEPQQVGCECEFDGCCG